MTNYVSQSAADFGPIHQHRCCLNVPKSTIELTVYAHRQLTDEEVKPLAIQEAIQHEKEVWFRELTEDQVEFQWCRYDGIGIEMQTAPDGFRPMDEMTEYLNEKLSGHGEFFKKIHELSNKHLSRSEQPK